MADSQIALAADSGNQPQLFTSIGPRYVGENYGEILVAARIVQ